jgi:hypothetical protein
MKWKYKVIALSNDAQANAKELNRLGLVRWELITVQGDKNAGFARREQPVRLVPKSFP